MKSLLKYIKKYIIDVYYLFLISFLLLFLQYNNLDFLNYYCVENVCNCVYKYDNPWPYAIDIYNCDGRYATSGWWYFKTIGIATAGYVVISIGTVLLLHYRGEL